MNIPQTIDIAGVTYQMIADDTIMSESGFLGVANCIDKTITIAFAAHTNELQLMHTLLHEIKHVQQYEYGLSQALERGILEVDAETTSTCLLKIFDLQFKMPAKPKKKATKKKKRK